MTFEMQGQEEDFGSKCAGGADKSTTLSFYLYSSRTGHSKETVMYLILSGLAVASQSCCHFTWRMRVEERRIQKKTWHLMANFCKNPSVSISVSQSNLEMIGPQKGTFFYLFI